MSAYVAMLRGVNVGAKLRVGSIGCEALDRGAIPDWMVAEEKRVAGTRRQAPGDADREAEKAKQQ